MGVPLKTPCPFFCSKIQTCIFLFRGSYYHQMWYFSKVLTWIYPETTRKILIDTKKKYSSQKYSQNMLSLIFFTTPLHLSLVNIIWPAAITDKRTTRILIEPVLSPYFIMTLWCSNTYGWFYGILSAPRLPVTFIHVQHRYVYFHKTHRRNPLSVGLILLPSWQCINTCCHLLAEGLLNSLNIWFPLKITTPLHSTPLQTPLHTTQNSAPLQPRMNTSIEDLEGL